LKIKERSDFEGEDNMQDEVTYREESLKEENRSFPVDQSLEHIQSYLDSRTELFNRKMEEIERRCYDPKENPDDLYSEVAKAINDICFICEEFEHAFPGNPSIIADAQAEFREKTNKILQQSYFVKRARTWPQGYPGDYKTLEDVYRNTPMSSGIGFYLDKCFLATTLGIGVRERLATLMDIIKAELVKRERPRVLNVACGSCRELIDAAPEVINSGAVITCIDFDSDALAFATNRLAFTGIAHANMMLRKYNALKMVNHERNRKEFGMQDIIYSTGFFDYVEDNTLVRLLKSAYSLLNPGGVLIASFKDRHRYRTQEYHWIVDWSGFLQRTEDDMWDLIDKAEIPRYLVETRSEKTEVIKFFIASK
jgi:extracellular factor (EF) 3-hydroxypalmitic acid methyl ester biosynthesis protein